MIPIYNYFLKNYNFYVTFSIHQIKGDNEKTTCHLVTIY